MPAMAGNTNLKTCIMKKEKTTAPVKAGNENDDKPLPTKAELKDSLLDHYDLEKMFNVKRGTIYNWCRKGMLKYIQIGVKRYFAVSDLHAMIKERKQVMVPGERKKEKK